MSTSSVPITEGKAPFKHPSIPSDTPCETWYQVHGDLEKSASGRPLVLVHGGPGACHNYLLSLKAMAPTHGVPVIFYDQLGNGNSTHLRHLRLDTSFWTPELFMDELENLLQHLGIEHDFDLMGQSWGGMLGSSWAASRQPKGLKRLVISNSPASMPLWVESCNFWRTMLPRDVDETLEKHERDQTYEDPEYEKAVDFFYRRHLCRMDPFPDFVQASLDWIGKDDTVYFTMNGYVNLSSGIAPFSSSPQMLFLDQVHRSRTSPCQPRCKPEVVFATSANFFSKPL